MTTINARPHLNGNDKEDFFAAYKALADARNVLETATRVVSANVLHGRNYQHMPESLLEQRADRQELHDLHQKARESIEQMMKLVYSATTN